MHKQLILILTALFLTTGCAERGYTLKSAPAPSSQSIMTSSHTPKSSASKIQKQAVAPVIEIGDNNEMQNDKNESIFSPKTISGAMIVAIAIIMLL